MSSSDWVALGGLIVSCFAFAVSLVAYRLQQRTARSDSEKELSDQIAAIQSQLSELAPGPSGSESSEADTIAALAKTSNVNAAVQTALLRAGSLIESAGLNPDWYQNLVLATAAVWIGDPVTAGPYAQNAVTLARQPADRGWSAEAGSIAQMMSLRVRAMFYFNRGWPDDVQAARDDFREARQIVQRSQQGLGPYITVGQLVELYLREADFELRAGHWAEVEALTAEACREWLPVKAPAVRQFIGTMIASFAGSQRLIPVSKLLTSDFVAAWEQFQRELRIAPGSAVPQGAVPQAAAPAPAAHADLSMLHPIRTPSGSAGPDR
jgi:hypothetical protein